MNPDQQTSIAPANSSACRWGFSRGDRQQAAMILRAARRATGSEREELTEQAMTMLHDSRPILRLRVQSLLAERDFEGAHALAVRGLLIKPNDAALMQYRAQALIALGRPDEALNEISELLRIQPQRVGALLLGARLATEHEQHERAVKWLMRAQLCRPHCESVKRALAEALMRAQQPDASLEIINTLPCPMPVLRARALRMLGRLSDAADVLNTAIASREADDQTPTDGDTLDELMTEALIVAELRGDLAQIKRLSERLSRTTPLATLQVARTALARGAFRRSLRLAIPLMNDAEHGEAALAIIAAAAGMLQRNRLAALALRRMRTRYGPAYARRNGHECWRRAMLGGIINDQRSPRRACADPTSSLLQPLLQQATATLERRVRRHATHSSLGVEQLREQHQLCRNALSLRPVKSSAEF